MRIFLTGATGLIGGAIAARLLADGHAVRGLVRDQGKADLVAAIGIEPVIGVLDDAALLHEEARAAEGVVNAASSDHRGAALALITGLSGSGKPLIHTSGSSIIADQAVGEPSDRVFDDFMLLNPEPARAARVELDHLILSAPGVRSAVLCNSMVYGDSLGAPAESVLIATFARQARDSGTARYVGRGLNRWSNVHLSDMADLYARALEGAPAGSFMYVENGEEDIGTVVQAIATRLRLSEAQPWSVAEASAVWGEGYVTYALGSNCRVRGRFAREHLGWTPRHASITEWIIQPDSRLTKDASWPEATPTPH